MLLLKYANIFFWNALEKKNIFKKCLFFFFFLDFLALIEMVGLIFFFFSFALLTKHVKTFEAKKYVHANVA